MKRAAALFVVLVIASGCDDPIKNQARAATITAGVLTAGGEIVTSARDEAFDAVEERYPTDPEHDAQLDIEAARWRPVGEALDTARTALGLWIDGIDLARIAGASEDLFDPLRVLAGRVIEAYGRAAEFAEALGQQLPTLPGWVLTLATSLIGGE